MAEDSWAQQVDDQERAESKPLEEQVKGLQITVNDSSKGGGGGGDTAVRKVEISIGRKGVVEGAGAAGSGREASGPPKPGGGPGDVGDTDKEEPENAPADVSLMRKALRDKLVKIKHEVEVLRKDPNSPLYYVKSFEELHLRKELLDGVYGMGFNWPSKIQETALPMLLADPPKNMIAQSQSGTGKTAAFVLAMLSRVDEKKRYPQAICLAPTYELALQIGEVAEKMGKDIPDLYCRYSIRGERVGKGQRIAEQIIIGTPGTTLDWAFKYKVFDMSAIRVFILDEADVMIATQGHQDQSIRIQRRLPRDCQMMLFSATYDDVVMKFAESIIPNASIIRLRREEESLDNIKQYFIECRSQHEKFEALSNIYGTLSIGQAMIFCHTRKTVAWLAEQMSKEGHAVAILSGDLTVDQRVAVLNRFREGKEKVLITTNVTARGIDVEQVTLVVNFDIPIDVFGNADCETYLHRIGRTGRFGKSGIAINMVDGPRSHSLLKKIEEHFDRKIVRLNADDVDEIEKLEA